MVVLYHQTTDTQISFWYKWINSRSFIEWQEILLVELIRSTIKPLFFGENFNL